MNCPKCIKRTKSIKFFNEHLWRCTTVCLNCGGEFEGQMGAANKKFEYVGQIATRRN